MAKHEKKPHLVTTRLTEAALAKIERLADADRRNRAEVMRLIIEKALKSKNPY